MHKKQNLLILKIFILTLLFIFLNILNFHFISASSISINSLIEKIGEFNLDDIGEGRPIFMKRVNDKIYVLTNFDDTYIPIQKQIAIITLPRITTLNKLVVLKASTTGFLDKLGEIFLDPNLGSFIDVDDRYIYLLKSQSIVDKNRKVIMFTGKINLIDANSYGQSQKIKEINLPEGSFSINIPDHFDIEDINDPIFKTENYMNFLPNFKDFLLSEGSVVPINSFNLGQDEAIYESFVKGDLGLFLIAKCESISMNERLFCSKEQLILKIFKISDKQLLARLDLEDIKKDKIVYIFFGDNKIFIITHGDFYSRREYQLFVIDVSQVSSPKIENKLTIKSSEDLNNFFIFGDYIYAVTDKYSYSYEKSTSSKLLVFKIDTFGVKEISKIFLNNKKPLSSFNLMKSNLSSIQMVIYENFLYLSTILYHKDMAVNVNEILIYDISNPQNIVQKGSFTFKNNNYPTSFVIYKNYVYVLTGRYPLTLIILDVSNPKSIKKIREITLSNDLARGRALYILDKYLVLQTFSKVVFFDISNLKNPLPIGTISLKGEKDFDIISIKDVSKFNNYLFINVKFFNNKGHSLDVDYLFDVSSIKSPKLIKKFNKPNNLPKETSAFYKNYFFLIDDDNYPVTIRVVSLEKSTLFQEVAKFQLKEKENSSILFRDQIALNNNLFFIPYYVDYRERIAIFDISNFKKIRRLPDIILQPGEKIFSLLTFKNNLFILTSYKNGYHKNFIVFDVSNPRLPSRKLVFDLPNKFFISQVSIYKNNLYVLSTSFPPKLIVFYLSVLAK